MKIKLAYQKMLKLILKLIIQLQKWKNIKEMKMA